MLLDATNHGVHVNEVDRVPIAHAIERVAERPPKNERQSPAKCALAGLNTPIERQNEGDRRHRNDEKERSSHVLARRLEHAPRPSSVLGENEGQVALPDLDHARIIIETPSRPGLRRRVSSESQSGDDSQKAVRRMGTRSRRGQWRGIEWRFKALRGSPLRVPARAHTRFGSEDGLRRGGIGIRAGCLGVGCRVGSRDWGQS